VVWCAWSLDEGWHSLEDQTFPAVSQLSSAGRSTTPLQAFVVWNIDSFRRLVCLRRSWDT